MSFAEKLSDDWPGWRGITDLQIFGCSYSSIGYTSTSPKPTKLNPLGVPFPGIPRPLIRDWNLGSGHLWTDNGTPNWVGHLISKSNPHSLVVHDYATGGANVYGVQIQIRGGFMTERALTGHISPTGPKREHETPITFQYSTTLFSKSIITIVPIWD